MAKLLQLAFKHLDLIVQVDTELQRNGMWRGVLIGAWRKHDLINALASGLEFDAPTRCDESVRSTFKVASREPMAVITEVTQRMRRLFLFFSNLPCELRFAVFQGSIFKVEVSWPNQATCWHVRPLSR
ncbi:MAG TPA: hypothetical protein VFT87_05345 [Candidatus Saccharimonadales bacterium]|nr:hypothetical protein [Candidatus Saccharimonadales bacterium]